jgi:hypothetical protein
MSVDFKNIFLELENLERSNSASINHTFDETILKHLNEIYKVEIEKHLFIPLTYANINILTNDNINSHILKFICENTDHYYTICYIEFYLLDLLSDNNVMTTSSNLHGGMNKHFINKFNKYFHKINNNTNSKYLMKYNYYKNILKGGNSTDTQIINEIVYNDKQFAFYGEAYQPIHKSNIKQYLPTSINTNQDNNIYDKFIKKYLYKRKYKEYSTDTFMKKLYDSDLYDKLFDIVIINLYLFFSKCILLFNIKNNIKITYKHIQLIYKGGNNMHFLFSIYGWESTFKTDNFLNKDMKIGDWDFSIIYNYLEINKLLTKDNIEKLINNIKTTMSIALSNIKKYLETNEDLFKLLTEFYNMCNESTEIDYNNIVDKCYKNDKHTSVLLNNIIPDNTHYKEKSLYNITHYKEKSLYNIDKFIDITESDNLKNNNFFITFIEKISANSFKLYNNFSLFRLKINNTITTTVNKEIYDTLFYNGELPTTSTTDDNIEIVSSDENSHKINVSAPIEMIDLSIENYNEEKNQKLLLINELYNIICKDSSKFLPIKYKLSNKLLVNLPILSQHYFFTDICSMLFIEIPFPWSNKKYEKRIIRLLKLYLLCTKKNNLIVKEFLTMISNYVDNSNTIEELKTYYLNFLKILTINRETIYTYIVNDNKLDSYLNIIHNNILDIILLLIYLNTTENEASILSDLHTKYCKESLEKILLCQNNDICDELDMEYYNIAKIKEIGTVEKFKTYLLVLNKIFTQIHNLTQTQVSVLPKSISRIA